MKFLKTYAVLAGAFSLLVLLIGSVGAQASTFPNGYTTGSETYETNYGPVPYGPVFIDDTCDIIKFDPEDPPSFVKVTVHVDTTGDHVDEGYHVVNYNHEPGLNYDTDSIADLTTGHAGAVALSWNIGSGLTAWVPFDCRPPCEFNENLKEGDEECVPPETTTTPTTTAPTTAATPTTASQPPITGETQQIERTADTTGLPRTGTNPWTLLFIGAGAFGIGISIMRWKNKRWPATR